MESNSYCSVSFILIFYIVNIWIVYIVPASTLQTFYFLIFKNYIWNQHFKILIYLEFLPQTGVISLTSFWVSYLHCNILF